MSFNYQRFIERRCTGKLKLIRNDTEILFDCPSENCENPKNHFYFNLIKNLGFCHRCGVGLNGVALLMIVEKLSYIQAIVYIRENGKVRGIKELRNKIKNLSIGEKNLLLKKTKFIIELPSGYVSRVTKAITDPVIKDSNGKRTIISGRGIKKSIAKKAGIGLCVRGNFKGRSIFPIECDGNKTFLAYDVKGFSRQKVLHAEGGFTTSECLYLYDWFKDSTKPLFVVEGTFDALRIVQLGYHANALFSTHVSDSHIYLLSKTNARELIFIWDSDVSEERLRKKVFDRLYDGLDKTFSYILLDSGDPDDLVKADFKNYIKNRIKYNKLVNLKRRLDSLR